MPDDILDTIDGALHDWETSGDAMRWVPEEDRTEERPPTLRRLPDGWRHIGYTDGHPVGIAPVGTPPPVAVRHWGRTPVLQARSLSVTPLTAAQREGILALSEDLRAELTARVRVAFDLPEAMLPDPRPILSPRDAEAIRAAFGGAARSMVRAVREAMVPVRNLTTRLAEIQREQGTAAEEPPTDPRERALWLRQHRNTGPGRDPFHNAATTQRHARNSAPRSGR